MSDKSIDRVARPALAACLLAIASALACPSVSADPAGSEHRKPSSLAPRHTRQHDYGAPIKPPILHKHKRAHAATQTGKGAGGSHDIPPK
jgi:hypothetical protein